MSVCEHHDHAARDEEEPARWRIVWFTDGLDHPVAVSCDKHVGAFLAEWDVDLELRFIGGGEAAS